MDSIRNATSKAGLTSSRQSLRYALTEREEEMLVCACLIYARQGTPFTVPMFAEVARTVAERDEGRPFSHHCETDFVESLRHELTMVSGKITSSNRLCLSRHNNSSAV